MSGCFHGECTQEIKAEEGCIEERHACTRADCLISHRPGLWTRPAGSGNVVESCGASTAARGVMWASTHPAERRFLSLRGSMWWPIAQAQSLNSRELLKTVQAGQAACW